MAEGIKKNLLFRKFDSLQLLFASFFVRQDQVDAQKRKLNKFSCLNEDYFPLQIFVICISFQRQDFPPFSCDILFACACVVWKTQPNANRIQIVLVNIIEYNFLLHFRQHRILLALICFSSHILLFTRLSSQHSSGKTIHILIHEVGEEVIFNV